MKKNQPYKVQHALEDGEFPVLHISNAVLAQSNSGSSKDDGRTTVTVSMKANGESSTNHDIKNLVIATLQPSAKDQVSLDLYLNVSQNITLACQGNGEVHLSGYFEPNSSLEDQMFGAAGGQGFSLDDDEEDEDEQEEITGDELKDLHKDAKKMVPSKEKGSSKDVVGFQKGGDLDKSWKDAKKNAIKNTVNEDSSDDDEDSDDEDEEEESDDDVVVKPQSKEKSKTANVTAK